MKRYTETRKWVDCWFLDLSCRAKAAWQFLCDNCDNAGFWEINLRALGDHLRGRDESIPPDEVKRIFDELVPKLEMEDGVAMLINFIPQQQPQGLYENNKAHQWIIRQLEMRAVKFVRAQELLGTFVFLKKAAPGPCQEVPEKQDPSKTLARPKQDPSLAQARPQGNGKGIGTSTGTERGVLGGRATTRRAQAFDAVEKFFRTNRAALFDRLEEVGYIRDRVGAIYYDVQSKCGIKNPAAYFLKCVIDAGYSPSDAGIAAYKADRDAGNKALLAHIAKQSHPDGEGGA